jgi:hypothetical protein
MLDVFSFTKLSTVAGPRTFLAVVFVSGAATGDRKLICLDSSLQ